MIKTKNGKTTFRGKRSDVASDFVCIIDSYKKALTEEFEMSEEEATKHIEECVELAFMTKEELHKKAKEELANFLTKVLEDIGNEKEEETTNE